jgi:uncharacterized RDD family membrane protein YckC
VLKEKPKEYSLEYAGFWIRLAAGLIDLIILVTSLYVLYCVVSQSFFWIFPDMLHIVQSFRDISGGAPISIGIIWWIATVLLAFLVCCTIYFVAMWAATGQTVGKMGMSIKVIRTDSSMLDLRCAFIRFLACLLCVLTAGIGFIVIAFDGRKQGLEDRFADTYVV